MFHFKSDTGGIFINLTIFFFFLPILHWVFPKPKWHRLWVTRTGSGAVHVVLPHGFWESLKGRLGTSRRPSCIKWSIGQLLKTQKWYGSGKPPLYPLLLCNHKHTNSQYRYIHSTTEHILKLSYWFRIDKKWRLHTDCGNKHFGAFKARQGLQNDLQNILMEQKPGLA